MQKCWLRVGWACSQRKDMKQVRGAKQGLLSKKFLIPLPTPNWSIKRTTWRCVWIQRMFFVLFLCRLYTSKHILKVESVHLFVRKELNARPGLGKFLPSFRGNRSKWGGFLERFFGKKKACGKWLKNANVCVDEWWLTTVNFKLYDVSAVAQ